LDKKPKEIKLSNIIFAVDEKVKTLIVKKILKKDVTEKTQNVLLTTFGTI
jgi:hypothetical protein